MTVAAALVGADIFLGLSGPGTVTAGDIKVGRCTLTQDDPDLTPLSLSY